MEHPNTLYAALGGEPAVAAAVEEFYARVLADATLAPLFQGIPLRRLKGHQRAFLAQALGGPARYAGRNMREAHAGLAITGGQFDQVAHHLSGALAALGVEADLIARVLAGIAPLRGQIVAAHEHGDGSAALATERISA